MQSFRTEIENPAVEKDIIELDRKIRAFREGKIHEEKFRSLRLARGVYGQRQQGVQMIRIKLPFGKLTAQQLLRIADVSDEYSTGNLHLTTRQDIQIHHVSLDRTPELWAELEKDAITLREACGNTVRNVTASAEAGIDPHEPFDVSPYAHAVFSYFLRKPFGQELGRKIKIAFSNSDADSAFTFIHDIGFIPKVKIENGQEIRGFKVLVAGGLGAQPFLAQPAFEFLHEDRIIPFIEATLRVFDRHGERANRHKARLKYLVAKTGLATFLELAAREEKALLNKTFIINRNALNTAPPPKETVYTTFKPADESAYHAWKNTNTFAQKQAGFFGVYIKITLGNIATAKARELARIVKTYAADDLRITINQGFLLRFVRGEALLPLYNELKKLQLSDPGFDSVADITACPGTDTCNLAISNSTHISAELEKVITEEFPELIYNRDIKIKLSGCMNSCGQHGLAQIGFHGSSFKAGPNVVPALQLLLGGGILGDGHGRTGDKIIKVASRRGPELLRTLLNDFADGSNEDELFNEYYDRRGKDYFYQLLKPLADTSTLKESDLIDWGQEEKFKPQIGVGECAGVVIDLVATLFYEADEKLAWSKEAFNEQRFGDSIYYSYASLISGAKALLLDKQVHVNTHHALISDFDKHFSESGLIGVKGGFQALASKINQVEPSRAFAERYQADAEEFLAKVQAYRSTRALEQTLIQN